MLSVLRGRHTLFVSAGSPAKKMYRAFWFVNNSLPFIIHSIFNELLSFCLSFLISPLLVQYLCHASLFLSYPR